MSEHTDKTGQFTDAFQVLASSEGSQGTAASEAILSPEEQLQQAASKIEIAMLPRPFLGLNRSEKANAQKLRQRIYDQLPPDIRAEVDRRAENRSLALRHG